jgi:hypothetical protein
MEKTGVQGCAVCSDPLFECRDQEVRKALALALWQWQWHWQPRWATGEQNDSVSGRGEQCGTRGEPSPSCFVTRDPSGVRLPPCLSGLCLSPAPCVTALQWLHCVHVAGEGDGSGGSFSKQGNTEHKTHRQTERSTQPRGAAPSRGSRCCLAAIARLTPPAASPLPNELVQRGRVPTVHTTAPFARSRLSALVAAGHPPLLAFEFRASNQPTSRPAVALSSSSSVALTRRLVYPVHTYVDAARSTQRCRSPQRRDDRESARPSPARALLSAVSWRSPLRLPAAVSARLAARRLRLKDAQSSNYTTTSMIASEVAHAFFVQFRLPLLGSASTPTRLPAMRRQLQPAPQDHHAPLRAQWQMPSISLVPRRYWALWQRRRSTTRLRSPPPSPSSFELSSSLAASCSAADAGLNSLPSVANRLTTRVAAAGLTRMPTWLRGWRQCQKAERASIADRTREPLCSS